MRISTIALLIAVLSNCSGQDPQLDKREIWDTNFLSKRPANNTKPLPTSQDDAFVGLTIWKLRPSRPSDEPGIRSLLHEDGQTQQWTPDRISADTVLHGGEKIRFSIESARSGYLYVIYSDEYANGTKGDFYLMFPELRIRGGDNQVTPGRVIELPSPNDDPPYFEVLMSRPDQVGERLTIFISPKPLDQVKIGNHQAHLSVDQVNQWIERWKQTEDSLEAKDQAGKPYTLAEKSAGSGEKLMTQADPVPQTMYLVKAKAGSPLVVHVPLSISK
jgi:hypothetical protein